MRQPTKDKAMDDDADLSRLADPEFLVELRRVREELEHQSHYSSVISQRD